MSSVPPLSLGILCLPALQWFEADLGATTKRETMKRYLWLVLALSVFIPALRAQSTPASGAINRARTANENDEAGNVGIKYASADFVQYVSAATGSNVNDGLSPGSAKLTIGAAHAALPSCTFLNQRVNAGSYTSYP
jgi:hypothetical protein